MTARDLVPRNTVYRQTQHWRKVGLFGNIMRDAHVLMTPQSVASVVQNA